MTFDYRERLKRSSAAPLLALPKRMAVLAENEGRLLARGARWLVNSRETQNFTYDLEPANREHLAWYVSAISGADIESCRRWFVELEGDAELREHLQLARERSAWRGISDSVPRFGRRLGWYAVVRALRPSIVVETGTDKGLGSCVFAAALLRNGAGRLVTIDIKHGSGELLTGPYATVSERLIGDSVAEVACLSGPIDLFLHDSYHTVEHETKEYAAVSDKLSSSALILSDNATVALPTWAEATGRRFLYFGERPSDHWYRGGGIGAAYRTLS